MKVSIIVPVHNEREYIADCISSLTKQTYKNIEIIVVENDSDGKTKKIVEKIAEKDKRIIVLTTNKAGVSIARNKGIERSTGDIIMFCDSDDEYTEHFVQNAKDSFNNQLELFISNYHSKRNKAQNAKEKKTVNRDDAIKDLFKSNAISGYVWNKAYVAKIIKDNSIRFDHDISVCEDLLFNVKYIKYCKSIIVTGEKLYIYRKHNSSITGNKTTNISKKRTADTAYDRIEKELMNEDGLIYALEGHLDILLYLRYYDENNKEKYSEKARKIFRAILKNRRIKLIAKIKIAAKYYLYYPIKSIRKE